MGYIKMAKKIKAKATGNSGEKKVKKKPIRTWLQKLFAKAKANKAKRKLKRESENRDTVRTREPNTDRVDSPRDNLLDKTLDAGGALVGKGKGGEMPTVQDNESEEIETANKIKKNETLIIVIVIAVILVILYFVFKKKA